MRSKTHSALLTLLLIGALVTLLTLLAVLQYKWLGQISAAERQTMQTNLRAQARSLQEEISREINLAISRLSVSMPSFQRNSGDELIERYARWKGTAAYPGLIQDIFKLLRYLIEHSGATVSRDELLNEVWGYNSLTTTRTVDVHISSLRQKIEDDPRHPRSIVTIHGFGYKFVSP